MGEELANKGGHDVMNTTALISPGMTSKILLRLNGYKKKDVTKDRKNRGDGGDEESSLHTKEG